jgi:hypothetical protein
LLDKIEYDHKVINYQDAKDLSDDFTETGDYDWEKSEVSEVKEGDKTFIKARAVWFDG